jgi:hypothetical protein
MDNMIYLLNMTVSGIKSIKKEIRLDFYKKQLIKILIRINTELKLYMEKMVPANLLLLLQ